MQHTREYIMNSFKIPFIYTLYFVHLMLTVGPW